jgi:Family of unknown function (DUF5984)
MALFEFELAPPGTMGSDNWFNLSWGSFRINVGEQVLFRYADGTDATYQLASFARDALSKVAGGVAPVPELIERMDRRELMRLYRVEVDEELHYTAFRWMGQRAPWMSYLSDRVHFYYLRIGDDLHIRWDNPPAWAAREGEYVLPVDVFLDECRGFADRLLSQMRERIDDSMLQQHEIWRSELASYLRLEHEPDIPWDGTLAALREIQRLT